MRRISAGDDPWISGRSRELREHCSGGPRERHPPCAGLAVGEPKLGGCEIDVFPAQAQHLVPAAAGQEKETDRRDRRRGSAPSTGGRLVQHLPQAPEFIVRKEALVLSFPVLVDEPARISETARAKSSQLGHVEYLSEKVHGPFAA